MKNVNRTLYIPLYGKSYVSKKNIILKDKKAEYIWEKEKFKLGKKSSSKWLSYYMAMRAACFDDALKNIAYDPNNSVVLHLGCGLDSRYERVGFSGLWYDIDFEDVINERQKYYKETSNYHMLGYDLRNIQFLNNIPKVNHAIIVMEGVSMYLAPNQIKDLFIQFSNYFSQIDAFIDVYTTFAAKASKYKNPINEVGVTEVFGYDEPSFINLTFIKNINMTPDYYISQLPKNDQFIFQHVYAGNFSKKLYRMYHFKK